MINIIFEENLNLNDTLILLNDLVILKIKDKPKIGFIVKVLKKEF